MKWDLTDAVMGIAKYGRRCSRHVVTAGRIYPFSRKLRQKPAAADIQAIKTEIRPLRKVVLCVAVTSSGRNVDRVSAG